MNLFGILVASLHACWLFTLRSCVCNFKVSIICVCVPFSWTTLKQRISECAQFFADDRKWSDICMSAGGPHRGHQKVPRTRRGSRRRWDQQPPGGLLFRPGACIRIYLYMDVRDFSLSPPCLRSPLFWVVTRRRLPLPPTPMFVLENLAPGRWARFTVSKCQQWTNQRRAWTQMNQNLVSC